MNGKRSMRIAMAPLVLLLACLACEPLPPPGTPPAPTATSKAGRATPTPAAPSPTADLSTSLWYLTRGDSKLDQGWGVDVDSQGNIYFGTFQQTPKELFADMMIYKFAPDGTELWHTRWGGSLQEKTFIVTVSEPYVYVGGLSHTALSLTEADMAVLALDMGDGHVVWEFKWGQGFGYEEVDGLVVDGDAIYVAGWTTGEMTSSDAAILKLDKAGHLVWARTWGTDGWDQADGQIVVDADTIYVVGRYNAPNIALGGEAYVAKFSKETGEYLAHRTWGGPIFNDALGMTSDGTYLYLVGLTLGFGNGGQIFLLKYDKDLNLLWQQLWGGPGGESARCLAVDAAGRILVAGNTDSYGNGANDIALLQYSPEGELLWSRTWGGPEIDAVQGIVLDGDVAYLAGRTLSYGNGQDDALLIKADGRTGLFPPAGR